VKKAAGFVYRNIPSAATEALPIAAVRASVFIVKMGKLCP